MKFGSVCSGIEAASVAWHPLGWKAAWLSEIEPFPCAVLKHHYPDVPNLGDMTLLPERILSGEVEAPDLFCGGTPCQAFSVAGLRNSLDDARGNLSLTFVGIANAIDHVRSVRGDAPAIVFWENVPGVLSTKDNAFGCFLAALAGESDPVTCPEGKWSTAGVVVGQTRTVAWRVLDAQYFGVAQRRRRVFVIASARNDFDPAEILFEFDSVRRDTAPSREKREDITHATSPCLTSSGRGVERAGDTRGQDPVVAVGFQSSQSGVRLVNTHATLDANNGSRRHNGVITMAHGQGGAEIATDRSPTLTCNHEAPIAAYSVAQPIPIHDQATRHAGRNGEKTMGKGNGLGIGQAGEPMNTLTKGDRHAVAQPTIVHGTQDPCVSDIAFAQGRNSGGENVMVQAMQVRRLTPVECERLQGFPDNYTDIKAKGKPTPDGPRYKALGNSWAVPVVAWIGERIAQRLESIPPKKNP
jgi:DNA (cytosine-5)-methyltransferase 1